MDNYVITSPTIETALKLHGAGLTIFPGLFKSKADNFSYGMLKYARLQRHHIPDAFAGRCNIRALASPGLLILDCDSPQAANRITAELELRGIPRYGWHTARGAHFLLFLEGVRSIKGTPAGSERTPDGIEGVDVRSTGQYVNAMGSMHPDGTLYRPFHNMPDAPPTVKLESLDFLRSFNGKPYKLKVGYARKAGKVADNYATTGKDINEGSRNNELFKAACDARNAGKTADETLALLKNAASTSGLSDKEIEATIRSAYEHAPKGGKHAQHVEQLLTFAAGHNWRARGRTGATDQRVFLALVERYRMTPPDEYRVNGFRASVREVAELARVSVNAVRASLRRLTGDDAHAALIKCARSGAGGRFGGDAAHYRFTNAAHKSHESDTLARRAKNMLIVCQIRAADGVMERGGLSLQLLTIHAVLSASKPLTLREIADATGLSKGQVQHVLHRNGYARQNGIVSRVEGTSPARYIAYPMTSEQLLERVPYAAIERTQARRNRHAVERSERIFKAIIEWRAKHDDEFTFYGGKRQQATAHDAPHIDRETGEIIDPARAILLGASVKAVAS